jgi:hypothetical protein
MRNFFHFFGFHQWSRWSAPKIMQVWVFTLGYRPHIAQARNCRICAKHEERYTQRQTIM